MYMENMGEKLIFYENVLHKKAPENKAAAFEYCRSKKVADNSVICLNIGPVV